MIQVHDLKKSFGANAAVDGITFDVGPGEAFGLLGPNGAGKSTAIAMMVGLLRPDSGTLSVAGEDPLRPETRQNIGLAPQALALYEDLTAIENLAFFARLQGIGGSQLRERIDWALDLSGLADRRKDQVRTYSGGMKRRLNIACALVHDPKIVFLDEPTVGVDPQSRNYIFESVENLTAAGLTVIYTTHYMEEAQRLCDRVAIMDHGKILALDSVSELIRVYGGSSLLVAEFEKAPDSLPFAVAEIQDTTVRITSKEPFQEVAKLADSGLSMKSLRIESPDLESVFLSLTGRSLRD